ncbi:Crp/Fnr family transcriptional regulator [Streptomyces sp. NPDC127190]|uniref:Crp/Fnr family transcriptional regulator n=1 Tax=unclassified Streptomyces TaxID=2593676 RepID=UPI00362770D3
MSEETPLSPYATLRDTAPFEAWRDLTGRPARRHPAGVTLLRQGEPGTHILVLLHGVVKVVRRSADGREKLLSFRGPGEVLGEMAVQDGDTRLADVQTITECKVIPVSARDFRDVVRRHGLGEQLARLAVSRLREQTQAGEGDLDRRLAAVLLRLLALSGAHTFRLTRVELAQHLDTGRRSVSEALRRLGPECVRVGRTSVQVVDERRLRAVLRQRPAA